MQHLHGEREGTHVSAISPHFPAGSSVALVLEPTPTHTPYLVCFTAEAQLPGECRSPADPSKNARQCVKNTKSQILVLAVLGTAHFPACDLKFYCVRDTLLLLIPKYSLILTPLWSQSVIWGDRQDFRNHHENASCCPREGACNFGASLILTPWCS